jgi:hypothetical protein
LKILERALREIQLAGRFSFRKHLTFSYYLKIWSVTLVSHLAVKWVCFHLNRCDTSRVEATINVGCVASYLDRETGVQVGGTCFGSRCLGKWLSIIDGLFGAQRVTGEVHGDGPFFLIVSIQ